MELNIAELNAAYSELATKIENCMPNTQGLYTRETSTGITPATTTYNPCAIVSTGGYTITAASTSDQYNSIKQWEIRDKLIIELIEMAQEKGGSLSTDDLQLIRGTMKVVEKLKGNI